MEINITDIQTAKRGYRYSVISKGLQLYGKGWLQKLKTDPNIERQSRNFELLKELNKPKKPVIRGKKARNVEKRSYPQVDKKGRLKDWAWKPPEDVKQTLAVKPVKKKTSKKEKKQRISRLDNKLFYESREWRELRVRVLEKYGCKCMMCGRSPKDHGIVLHVDHIKPRSKYPELSLVFENLQVLCEDDNLGKLNKYDTDYRPDV